ncbi:hypothetical protein CDD80_5183 [Ophiocordyceps camponoti-rufipedis]|uniref:Uncharacterized protein n=1 Tax=Ophiocordyceps camponoti-rufipedis TaxID=2004952 RepID=A0A2C5ZMA9_9HYPO|nr:hypothetical protein CDD80_5183 [Ophiocordyceps camponoti-rufipedis]
MDLKTAAAVPVAYCTALYALRDVARLEMGESILIHSEAGAVGQAAITIARFLGAEEIFVTAGSKEKPAFITEKFGIPSHHVLSSRELTFGDEIAQLTDGHGVDVILNSLSEEALAIGCRSLSPFGRFIEVGKRDIVSNERLEMRQVEKKNSFSAIDLDLVARERPQRLKELLETSLRVISLERLDIIQPLSVRHASQVEEQLRTMQTGKHMGNQYEDSFTRPWLSSLFQSMSHEQWHQGIAVKAHGTDLLCETLADNLDFFILLGSASAIVGGRGQGNYGADNTVQDSIARHQAALGRPCIAIDAGVVLEAGWVARRSSLVDQKLFQQ